MEINNLAQGDPLLILLAVRTLTWGTEQSCPCPHHEGIAGIWRYSSAKS